MLDDQSIIRIYIGYRTDLLPLQKQVYDKEKSLLSKKNIFNKRKIDEQIILEYKSYLLKLEKVWSSIYTTHDQDKAVFSSHGYQLMKHGYSPIKNISQLAHLMEQIFYINSNANTAIVMYYEGMISKKSADTLHDGAEKLLVDMLRGMDDYVHDYLK